jgi:hypothetical protein
LSENLRHKALDALGAPPKNEADEALVLSAWYSGGI